METRRLVSLADILEECSDIELELEDASDFIENLMEDIQSVIDELKSELERIEDHMSHCRSLLRICTADMVPDLIEEEEPKELLWV